MMKNNVRFFHALFPLLLPIILSLSCKSKAGSKPQNEAPAFAKGADIGWITEMEASGKKFYNAEGVEMDGLTLLKSLGMNAVRLRVWVNPANGWCGKEDVLAKAVRADNLGMRIMVDFHYSDFWADPGKQNKPAAWQGMDMDGLKTAIAKHTHDVLQALKDKGIAPEWVQVGNETGNGMLWEEGKASVNMANYAALNNAGYDAVKDIFPETDVIVHLQNGNDNSLFRWLFDGLKANNGKWDVIGMSLYPTEDTWSEMNADCLANMEDMIKRYGTPVMICEVGMSWDEATACKQFLTGLMAQCKTFPEGMTLGVFYWEPLAYDHWKGYAKGAFDTAGRPTEALDAFK